MGAHQPSARRARRAHLRSEVTILVTTQSVPGGNLDLLRTARYALPLALVLVGSCNDDEGPCTLLGCLSIAEVDVITATPQELAGSMIELCINARCASGPTPQLAVDDLGATTTVTGDFYGRVAVRRARDSQHAQVTAEYINASDLRSGDIYSVTISRTDGSALIVRSWTAASYEQTYPNGPDCGTPCYYAALTPST